MKCFDPLTDLPEFHEVSLLSKINFTWANLYHCQLHINISPWFWKQNKQLIFLFFCKHGLWNITAPQIKNKWCFCPHRVAESLIARFCLSKVLLSWKLTPVMGLAFTSDYHNTQWYSSSGHSKKKKLPQQKHCVHYQTTTHARTMFATFCTLIFSPKQTTNFSHIFTLIGNKTPLIA